MHAIFSFFKVYNINMIYEIAKLCIPASFVTIRPNNKPLYYSEICLAAYKHDRHILTVVNSGNQSVWLLYKQIRNNVNNMKSM